MRPQGKQAVLRGRSDWGPIVEFIAHQGFEARSGCSTGRVGCNLAEHEWKREVSYKPVTIRTVPIWQRSGAKDRPFTQTLWTDESCRRTNPCVTSFNDGPLTTCAGILPILNGHGAPKVQTNTFMAVAVGPLQRRLKAEKGTPAPQCPEDRCFAARASLRTAKAAATLRACVSKNSFSAELSRNRHKCVSRSPRNGTGCARKADAGRERTTTLVFRTVFGGRGLCSPGRLPLERVTSPGLHRNRFSHSER